MVIRHFGKGKAGGQLLPQIFRPCDMPGYIEIQLQVDNDFEPIVLGASYYFGHLNRNPFVIKPTGHRQQSNIENFPLGAKLT